MPITDTFLTMQVIAEVARRRRFTTEQKLAAMSKAMQPRMSINFAARRYGLPPSPVFGWRRVMGQCGKEVVRVADDIIGASEVRRLEEGTIFPPQSFRG